MSRSIEVPAVIAPAPGKRALFSVGGHTIALFNVDGEIFAIDDRCPHAGASLLCGVVTGRIVQCRAHGMRFDLASGRMPNVPSFGVTTFPVELRDGRVFISLPGETALA